MCGSPGDVCVARLPLPHSSVWVVVGAHRRLRKKPAARPGEMFLNKSPTPSWTGQHGPSHMQHSREDMVRNQRLLLVLGRAPGSVLQQGALPPAPCGLAAALGRVPPVPAHCWQQRSGNACCSPATVLCILSEHQEEC